MYDMVKRPEGRFSHDGAHLLSYSDDLNQTLHNSWSNQSTLCGYLIFTMVAHQNGLTEGTLTSTNKLFMEKKKIYLELCHEKTCFLHV